MLSGELMEAGEQAGSPGEVNLKIRKYSVIIYSLEGRDCADNWMEKRAGSE